MSKVRDELLTSMGRIFPKWHFPGSSGKEEFEKSRQLAERLRRDPGFEEFFRRYYRDPNGGVTK
jgi:hypothetical protein